MARKHKCFVMLEKELLTCESFKNLSSKAQVLFIYFKLEAGRQFGNGMYEGEFRFPYRKIKQSLYLSDPTLSSKIKELIEAGFLIKSEPGGGLYGTGGVATKYRLSLNWQKSSPIIKQKQTIRQKKARLYQSWVTENAGSLDQVKRQVPLLSLELPQGSAQARGMVYIDKS